MADVLCHPIQRILYNGFTRSILSQNPPRVDADGDVIDEAEDESDVDLTPAEDDPFAEIALHSTKILSTVQDLKLIITRSTHAINRRGGFEATPVDVRSLHLQSHRRNDTECAGYATPRTRSTMADETSRKRVPRRPYMDAL